MAYLFLFLSVFLLCSTWVVYNKAGYPGWACVVPIYNLYILIRIAKRPGWWFFLMLIPLFNLIFFLMVTVDIAKAFGKGTAFGFGLGFLPFIFYPILALGESQYQPTMQEIKID